MTTGIVLTSMSVPFLLIGAAVSKDAYDDCVVRSLSDSWRNGAGFQEQSTGGCENARRTRAFVILGTTVGMLSVGIPLIVYGAKKVPARREATLTPWISAAAGGATLKFSL